MLACFACGSASALSVTANFAETTTTYDTSANFTAAGYSYDASTGVITYDAGFSKFEATITLNYTALTALSAKTDLLSITADKGTWGFRANAASGEAAPIFGFLINGNDRTTGTKMTAAELAEYVNTANNTNIRTEEGVTYIDNMKATIDGIKDNGNGTQLKTSEGGDVYVDTGLKYTPAIISSAKLDKNLITSITLKDVGSYTVSNASGTWTKDYTDSTKVSFNSVASSAKDATILDKAVLTVNPDGIGNGNAGDLSANGGDIIIGGSGQLFLQTWVSATEGGDISLGNDIYLGATTQTTGAIRFGAYSGDITLNGAVTLVEDAKITKEPDLGNDNQVTISGKVSGNYTLTLAADTGDKVDDISFAGGMDVSGLTIASASELTFAQQTDIDTLNLQAGAAHSLAFNGATTIGTLTMSDDSTLNIGGSGAVSIGGGTLSGTIEYSGSNTVTLNGNVTIADVTDLQTGDGVTYSENDGKDGYISSAEFIVIEGTGESSAAALGTSGLKLNNTYDLTVSDNGKNVVAYVDEENPSGVYYVNTTVNYGGEGGSSQIVADTTTGITMNGGTLNLNTELANGVNISTLKTGSTINLAAGVTLNNSAVTPGEVQSTLSGSNTAVYNMGTVAIDNNNRTPNVTIGDEWYGTVVFASGTTLGGNQCKFNIDDFANGSHSTVEFAGASGYLGNPSTTGEIDANIKLTGNGLTLTNGYDNQTTTFNGDFSGTGNWTLQTSKTHVFAFKGDMRQWSGELEQTIGGTYTYNYSAAAGKDTTIANKFTVTGGTMNVNVNNSAAVSMTGDITAEGGALNLTKTGGSKLSVTNMAAKTSNIVLTGAGENAIEVGTLSIASGKSVSGAADVTVTTKLAVAAENALVLTGALTMGDNATIDLTGLNINDGQTIYTLATASNGVSLQNYTITGLDLTGTMYEGYRMTISAMDSNAAAGIALLADEGNTNTNALVLTLTQAADTLTSIIVNDGSFADGVLTLTTNVEDATAVVFGDTLNATMSDEVWDSILEKYGDAMGEQVKVSFADASGKLLDFDGANNTDTPPTITINGEGAVGTQVIEGNGTIVGNYVTAYIPEPATSTLSLLALAALAARRRRR